MSENFKNHIKKYVKINEEEYNKIITYVSLVKVKKKENLHEEGKVCKTNYFVISGCLRLFFINEKGVEHTIQFALENWWLSDYTSFSLQLPSDFYIQAIEHSEVLALDFTSQEKMLFEFPFMEKYFRCIHQRAHAAAQFRIKSLYTASREEIYNQFILKYPEFVKRIPQYLLASFLGFTPEYLSEIRNKKIS